MKGEVANVVYTWWPVALIGLVALIGAIWAANDDADDCKLDNQS
jgi:hypothetical protein